MNSKIWIIGVDSLIGNNLYNTLDKGGFDVHGTTRRNNRLTNDIFHLDLANPVWDGGKVDVAVFCAGITNMRQCEEQPHETSLINVQNTLKLAKIFHDTGAKLIFLSSDKALSLTCEYGRQKAAAERGFCDMGGTIVRLSKILPVNFPLFAAWVEKWKNNCVIEAFSDLFFSPVPLEVVVRFLELLISSGEFGGIYQISGERDISYYDAARIGARVLGFPQNLVNGTLSGTCAPGYSSMDSSLAKSRFGIFIPPVEETIKERFLIEK